MRGYIIKRLLLGIPTILGAMLLIFTIMRVIPGDVAVLIAVGGSEGEEVVAEGVHVRVGAAARVPAVQRTSVIENGSTDTGALTLEACDSLHQVPGAAVRGAALQHDEAALRAVDLHVVGLRSAAAVCQSAAHVDGQSRPAMPEMPGCRLLRPTGRELQPRQQRAGVLLTASMPEMPAPMITTSTSSMWKTGVQRRG